MYDLHEQLAIATSSIRQFSFGEATLEVPLTQESISGYTPIIEAQLYGLGKTDSSLLAWMLVNYPEINTGRDELTATEPSIASYLHVEYVTGHDDQIEIYGKRFVISLSRDSATDMVTDFDRLTESYLPCNRVVSNIINSARLNLIAAIKPTILYSQPYLALDKDEMAILGLSEQQVAELHNWELRARLLHRYQAIIAGKEISDPQEMMV
jgi:hypothetical protein